MDEFPKTWGSDSTEKIISDRMSLWQFKKDSIAFSLGFHKEIGYLEFRNYISIPEIMAYESCLLINKKLLSISPPLQAFQSYRIYLYDMISDNHLEIFDEPTILGRFGENYTRNLAKIYENAVKSLSEELEINGVKNALFLAKKQYSLTIKNDKIRNKKYDKLPSPDFAIKNNNDTAGGHARYISKLSGGNNILEEIVGSLANAMACCDDFVDMIRGDDLKNKKLTIPLSFLEEEIGRLEDFSFEELKRLALEEKTISKTKNYITKELENAVIKLRSFNEYKNSLFYLFISDIKDFLNNFPDIYLK